MLSHLYEFLLLLFSQLFVPTMCGTSVWLSGNPEPWEHTRPTVCNTKPEI